MKTIDDLIKELPPELRDEVEDFIQFLIERRLKKPMESLHSDGPGPLGILRKNILLLNSSIEYPNGGSEANEGPNRHQHFS